MCFQSPIELRSVCIGKGNRFRRLGDAVPDRLGEADPLGDAHTQDLGARNLLLDKIMPLQAHRIQIGNA